MVDTEKLIYLIEQNECIWNTTRHEYLNKYMKEKAWEEIASELNPNFNDISLEDKEAFVVDIKKKWSNIRDYYRKDKKSIENAASGAKKRKYIYADMLSFLDEIIENRSTHGNFEHILVKEDRDDETIDTCTSFHIEENNIIRKPPNKLNRIKPVQSEIQKLLSNAQGNIEHIYKKEDQDDEIIEKNKTFRKSPTKSHRIKPIQLEILKILKNRQESVHKSESSEALFLLSFVSEVEQMTPMQKIEFKVGMVDLLKKIKYSTNLDEQHMQYNHQFSTTSQTFYTNDVQRNSQTPLPQISSPLTLSAKGHQNSSLEI